jgi:hypothetical protein
MAASTLPPSRRRCACSVERPPKTTRRGACRRSSAPASGASAASRSARVSTGRISRLDVGERVAPRRASGRSRRRRCRRSRPAGRSALTASRTAPPEVMTSSIRVTRLPSTSGPSASLAVPYSLASLRTKSDRDAGLRADHRGDRDAAHLQAAEQLGALGEQVDHLLRPRARAARAVPRRGTCRSTCPRPARAERELAAQAAGGVDVGGELGQDLVSHDAHHSLGWSATGHLRGAHGRP